MWKWFFENNYSRVNRANINDFFKAFFRHFVENSKMNSSDKIRSLCNENVDSYGQSKFGIQKSIKINIWRNQEERKSHHFSSVALNCQLICLLSPSALSHSSCSLTFTWAALACPRMKSREHTNFEFILFTNRVIYYRRNALYIHTSKYESSRRSNIPFENGRRIL